MQAYVPTKDPTTMEAERGARHRGASRYGGSSRDRGAGSSLWRTLALVAVAVVAAVLASVVLVEPALAAQDGSGGGQTMDLEGAAQDIVAIGVAFILAIIILRFIPDLGKKAYASIAILIIVGSIVYYLAQNPESFESIGAFFGELLSLGGGDSGN